MVIVYWFGKKYINVDGMSCLRDVIFECDCYNVGVCVEDFFCEGCCYCQKVYVQWGRFSEDVDDVVFLVNRFFLFVGLVFEVRVVMQVDEKFELDGF